MLLHPPLHYSPFLLNFSNEEKSSMLGVVRKEKHPRYLANLAVNFHPKELGAYSTKFIADSGSHSNIARTNMYVAPHHNKGLRSHHQILL